MKPRIAIGADHGGFTLKNELVTHLQEGYEVIDLGAYKLDPDDDYTDIAKAQPVRWLRFRPSVAL